MIRVRLSPWQILFERVGFTEDEGRRLQQIVRRQTGSPIRLRRAMVIVASASGNTVPAIARLVQCDEDAIREVTHRFTRSYWPVWTLMGGWPSPPNQ